ncbi:MAG TPA: c-type cytochrome [Candidatus Acidoferrales bacterium]|nr:c-type cytochrome [Candidatus Acidoferrales bacterium]
MWKECAVLSTLLFFGISGAPQNTAQSASRTAKPVPPAASAIPPDVAKQPNPIKPTPASIAQGKQMYGYDCAMCHGADGSGKGDLAADMKLTLKDYRDAAALKDMTDGEMFYIIQKGKGDMSGEGDRQKPEGIWNMINYIRSLSRKPHAAKTNPAG